PFLRDMLRHAFYWRTPVGDEEPPLTRYVNGWGRPGDRSLIVFDEFVPVGAAWYRLFTGEDAGFGFVDEQTPELAIAVVPSRRGRRRRPRRLYGCHPRRSARREGRLHRKGAGARRHLPARRLHPDEGLGADRVRDQGGRAHLRQARRPGRRPDPGFRGRERVE